MHKCLVKSFVNEYDLKRLPYKIDFTSKFKSILSKKRHKKSLLRGLLLSHLFNKGLRTRKQIKASQKLDLKFHSFTIHRLFQKNQQFTINIKPLEINMCCT